MGVFVLALFALLFCDFCTITLCLRQTIQLKLKYVIYCKLTRK